MNDKPPVLELRNVVKSFGALEIIRGVNLTVKQNERHALIGPNGAGKSTLFNLISGAMLPNSGEIRLNGKRIDAVAPDRINRAGLGRSFQITSIFQRLSVIENLRIAVMRHFGVHFSVMRRLESHAGINARAIEMMEAVGLAARRNVAAGELSYSEQRAMEIGLTLATNPSIVLLDEPTSGMSPAEATHFVELIKSVTRDKTLLVVEHDMDVVFQVCNRISVLVFGNVIASGTPNAIKADPAVRQAYLGKLAQ